jgi:hypothetical protein
VYGRRKSRGLKAFSSRPITRPSKGALPRWFQHAVLLAFDQEGVALAFFANGGEGAVARDHYCFIGQGHERIAEGAQDFLHGATGEIGASDRAGEEGVAGDEFLVGREIEAHTAFGMAGGVEDAGGNGPGRDAFTGGDALIDLDFAGGAHADPGGLLVEHFQKGIVILIEQDGSAGEGAEFHRSADVVDVGVSDDDLLDLKVVFLEKGEDVFEIITGVDDHCFAGGFVSDDGAVALQGADREYFVDHGDIVATRVRGKALTTKDTKDHEGKPESPASE